MGGFRVGYADAAMVSSATRVTETGNEIVSRFPFEEDLLGGP